jgi:hypothetical protein
LGKKIKEVKDEMLPTG